MRCLATIPLLLFLSVSAYAQPVHIPDSSLRHAIANKLGIPQGVDITRVDMERLIEFHVDEQGVRDLRGMETAVNLRVLSITVNPISDLNPIAKLTRLEFLGMWGLRGADITPLANLANLRGLDIAVCDISDISPLSRLTNLTFLNARKNRIADLTPLANLANLVDLYLNDNRIIDIAPLANLTNLVNLHLNDNRIIDLTPLANLTNLVQLRLSTNMIRDVSPLSGLSLLEFLEIQRNEIVNHNPLNALPLSHFIYDETCDMPPIALQPRLNDRTFPSIFARWSGYGAPPVSNRPDLSDAENIALHDLWFGVGVFGLALFENDDTFTIRGNIEYATRLRDELLANNPNIIYLTTLSALGAPWDSFPKDSPYWLRDEQGNIFLGMDHDGTIWTNGIMDITHPEVQDRIVQQAIAIDKCGLYDGIIFDYWSDSWRVLGGWDGTRDYFPYSLDEERHARLNIVRRIQGSTRPNFLIMGNTNRATLPITGRYVNGGFMETGLPSVHTVSEQEEGAHQVAHALAWLDTNLREPRINGLEGWAIPTEAPDSPNNLRWMRAITTLSLTHSDGYVVYTITNEWTHYWYDFWDADLGRPVGEKGQLYENREGLFIREFTNG